MTTNVIFYFEILKFYSDDVTTVIDLISMII